MRGLCPSTFHFFFFLRSQFEPLYSFDNKVNKQTGFLFKIWPLFVDKTDAKILMFRNTSFYHWIALNVATGLCLLNLKKKKNQLQML